MLQMEVEIPLEIALRDVVMSCQIGAVVSIMPLQGERALGGARRSRRRRSSMLFMRRTPVSHEGRGGGGGLLERAGREPDTVARRDEARVAPAGTDNPAAVVPLVERVLRQGVGRGRVGGGAARGAAAHGVPGVGVGRVLPERGPQWCPRCQLESLRPFKIDNSRCCCGG